ncbi:HetP family heterocyst commitment protein [Calothrix sp. NIES-2098]|uniref:HetP family heterocyst commitment protein n=1 Tax=Calothrix sp. NIES-2098 TaxID=1954171 RepID=UPI000B609424|nr:heterocyst differentiation protein [Calothrix sp. NIES-2098]
MNQEIPGISSKLKDSMHPEQFDQVVEAILAGKYSWACVLMLRFAGYNPLHYIPYRTYNRLLKENSLMSRSHSQQNPSMSLTKQSTEKRTDTNISPNSLSKIKDVTYLEVVSKQKAEIRNKEQWLTKKVQ